MASLVLLSSLGVGAAAASEPSAQDDDPDGVPESAQIHRSAATLAVDLTAASSRHVWIWSAGQKAYHLESGLLGFDEIVSVDLTTNATSTQPLSPEGYYSNHWNQSSRAHPGLEHVITIDEESGRLFLATQRPAFLTGSIVDSAVSSTAGAASATLKDGVCAQATTLSCLSGVTVLDAETLQPIRHIPLRGLQADGGAAAPQLLAMSYAPAFEGMAPKLHLLIQDMVHSPGQVGTVPRYHPRHLTNITYLVQLDPESGVQDWTIRLDACRGSRPGRTVSEADATAGVGHEAAVFRGRTAGMRAVFVACSMTSSSLTGGVVRVSLDADGMLPAGAASLVDDVRTGTVPSGGHIAAALQRPVAVEGPDNVFQMRADPESGRFALQVMDGLPLAQVWWVFDTALMQFIGTIGIGGPMRFANTASGISHDGELYTLTRNHAELGKKFTGGLFAANIRRTPVPQALYYPDLEPSFLTWNEKDQAPFFRLSLSVQRLPDGRRRIWIPGQVNAQRTSLVALDDDRPSNAAPPPTDDSGRTLDLPEQDGVTSSSADGAARGYGVRALLVAGAEGSARLGPADPIGAVGQCNDPVVGESDGAAGLTVALINLPIDRVQGDTPASGGNYEGWCRNLGKPLPMSCLQGDREVILASVGPQGPAVVDAAGARGAAEPVMIDSITKADAETPASRCANQDWDQIWGTALFGRAPAGEPTTGVAGLPPVAQCVSASDTPSARVGDPVANGYSAQVTCQDDEASGSAYARGFSLPGVNVAEAVSSFRIYRDPERGIVSRVESVARGVSIDANVRIDAVRGSAESWANGRRQPIATTDRDPHYDPNCDVDRTAGTCFRRQLFGVWTPGYACGPCGDEQALVSGLNAVLNPYSVVRLREPDVRLRQGGENGFAAAVQKPEHERFADLVLNNDLLQTVLPTLEVVRYAPPNRTLSRGGPRGRQIYQFAGVEVSSSYGIACLLVYDEATNTCAASKEEPGSIVVNLTDPDGKALAGGAFEVRQDIDTDGVVGLKDALLPNGACVTADDGVGTCKFDALQPGSYLVSQVAAPPGYGKVADSFVVELASGEARTVTFQNTSNVSTIAVSAADEAGKPVSGAQFAVYPDADSDGKVAADAKPAATCTTDASGSCSMQVPAGSYVLVQSSAPGGLESIEPVAFTFASGGQTAAVGVVNYPAGAVSPVEPAASPVGYSAPPQQVVTETVDDYQPTAEVADVPQVSIPQAVGGTIVRVIQAPGDALRLLTRDPKQAAAWTASLMLFALALMAVRRRQEALRTLLSVDTH